MRILALAISAIGMVSIGPAASQTYDPGVMECACIGVPDEKTGEAVKLFVVKAPNATLTNEELVTHCRKEMTAYKTPKTRCAAEVQRRQNSPSRIARPVGSQEARYRIVNHSAASIKLRKET